MTKLKSARYYLPILAILIFAALPLVVTSPYYLHIMAMVLFWAYLACAWNIVGGFAGQLSLGHGVYLATGAYISSLLFSYLHISPWLGMIIGGAAAALLGVVVGYPTLRLKGAYYALATVGFAEGFKVILINTTDIGPWHTGGAEGFLVPLLGESALHMQFLSKVPYYYIALAMLLLIIGIIVWIDRSRLGYYLTALREDEDAARALGINTSRAKLTAAILSAFFTGVGGVFYAQLIRYLEPNAVAGEIISNQIVFLAIVGGRGTVMGPVLGGFFLTIIGEMTRTFFDQVMGLHLFIYGVIVVLFVIFKPKGLIAGADKMYQRVVNFLDGGRVSRVQSGSVGTEKSNG